jgi:hypothetical protein
LALIAILVACEGSPDRLEQSLKFSGDNRSELEKVLSHYKQQGDKQKLQAAEFLIANMLGKCSYEGDILEKYDTLFCVYDSLFQKKVYDREPQIIKDTWQMLEERYGTIAIANLTPLFDCQTLSSNFLIQNIDAAFDAWAKSPLHGSTDFEMFCQYVLPHRAANEKPEVYRSRYYADLKHILDTVTSPEGVLQGFSEEFTKNRHYVSSHVLWDYPVELPVSTMERIRKGACRHMTTFCALSMRACGLPVSIDRAVWANRSQGHSWNVLLTGDSILPFDAFDKRRIKFAYKPAKIFRKTYGLNHENIKLLKKYPYLKSMIHIDEIDVTHQYVPSYTIAVPLLSDSLSKKTEVIICSFNNKVWQPVYYGKIKGKKIHFENMASDVAYIGAFYENGNILPATQPFMLRADGSIDYCQADENAAIDMRLERKYPLSETMKNRAHGLMEMQAEGSNEATFKNPTVFFIQKERTYNMTDSLVNNLNRFRYIRLNFSKTRDINLAEVKFYGKKNADSKEEKLSGKIFGAPNKDENGYQNAMDGNLENFFIKDKRSEGWVGLDLGKGNEHIITRIRFCPRSDTNFILEGDDYELMYWSDGKWKSAGRKRAKQYNFINFRNVPSKLMYLLHNHSRGKEERIFTYENGNQVWW